VKGWNGRKRIDVSLLRADKNKDNTRRQGYLSIKGLEDTVLGAWSIAVKATIKRSGLV
jgi:hypothetical protein